MATVLIVEDETNVRKLVAVNLINRGYMVLEAMDVQHAFEQLRSSTPDLMVLDIKLPDLTGWEFLAQIANDPSPGLKFPVLVMTASITEAQVDREHYPQVADILIKPFSVNRLMAAVERALHPSAHR